MQIKPHSKVIAIKWKCCSDLIHFMGNSGSVGYKCDINAHLLLLLATVENVEKLYIPGVKYLIN